MCDSGEFVVVVDREHIIGTGRAVQQFGLNDHLVLK